MPSAINAFKSPARYYQTLSPAAMDGRGMWTMQTKRVGLACMRRHRHLLLDDVKCHRVEVRPFGGQGLIEVL